jgi:hypothetical protein
MKPPNQIILRNHLIAVKNKVVHTLVFLCAVFAASSLIGDTFVPTTISTTTWTKSGNNYIIAADATVPSGQVLTIEPGVAVVLAPGVQLNVQGRILAVGSPAEHITFRGVSAENYWNRVFVQDNGNGLSRFYWCDFADLWRSAKLSRVCSDKLSQRLEAEGAASSFQGVD